MCYNAFIENTSLLTDLGTTESELKKVGRLYNETKQMMQ